MKWINAISVVLAKNGGSMHYEDITKEILNKGYRTATTTTENTVNSYLSTNPDLFNSQGRGYYEFIFNWRNAIRVVLAENGGSMHYDDITKEILNKGYMTTSGATPERTVSRELSTNPNLFRNIIPGQGIYELIDTSVTAPHSPKIKKGSLVTSTTVGGLAPVVVGSCTSYTKDDKKYKKASDFVDSPALSQSEVKLLELIVNFRLPLVEEEVYFADILDKLDVEILEEGLRDQSIDADILRKKLNELQEHIAEVENDSQYLNMDEALLGRMRSAAYESKRRLKETFGEMVEFEYPILGEFIPGDGESNPKVVIYLKSIEKSIEKSILWYESRESVMAGVFVHEMFHAWNYFNAGPRSVLAIDEPMVEFATLYFLKKLEDFTTSQKDKVKTVRENREERVKNKQGSIGDVAAYGFGYYLFTELSKSDVDSIQWIETYSKKSASIKSSKLVENLKDALIPVYPFKLEKRVMEWFNKIIFAKHATYKIAGKSATAKVALDVSLRKLVLACIETIGRKCFEAKELHVFAPIFEACGLQRENLENKLKQQLDELVTEGFLDALPHDCYSMK